MIGPWIFVAALAFAWLNSALHVLWSDRPMYAVSGPALRAPVSPRRAIVLSLATVAYLGALWVWFGSGWPRVGASLVIASLFLLRQWEVRTWPGDMVVRLGKYAPAAACLLGWLVTASVLPALGFAEADALRLGWEGAAGVMAALYVLAAASKVQKSGLSWMRYQHQALLIAERAYSGPGWVRAARRWTSRRPRLCAAIGVLGFGAELAFGLYVFPGARVPLTAFVLGLHVSIMVLLGYVEPEWILAMVGITVVTA
jgi:hypothetical protein